MIAELEQRLAATLRARLPAPFTGRVHVVPGPAAGAQPAILLGVERAVPVAADFASRRPETPAGRDGARRVLRLSCVVGLAVRPATNGGAEQVRAGIDAALYALDAPDMRDGTALRDAGDAGFQLEALELVALEPRDALRPDADTVLHVRADGWFWPVGTEGASGVAIETILSRGATLPLDAAPPRVLATAGGDAVVVTLGVRSLGVPLQRLAALAVEPGGRAPGAGAVGGGVAGSDGVRLLLVSAEGTTTMTYAPPATATRDEILLGMPDPDGGVGIEVGRVAVEVRA